MLKKSLWIILILAVFTAFLYFGGAEKIMTAYYANKTGQEVEQVEKYFDKVDEYTEKIEQDVNNFDYRIELSRSYEYAGRLDKAIEIYEEYADQVSDDIFYLYHNNLASLYSDKGEYQTAIDHYLMITDKYGDEYYGIYLKIANAYLELDDKDQASEYYFKYRAISGAQDGAFEQRAGLDNY